MGFPQITRAVDGVRRHTSRKIRGPSATLGMTQKMRDTKIRHKQCERLHNEASNPNVSSRAQAAVAEGPRIFLDAGIRNPNHGASEMRGALCEWAAI